MTKFSVLFLLLCCVYINSSGGNPAKPLVTTEILPPGTCIGTQFILNDIVITETNPDDFNVSGSGTIVIESSSGSFVGAQGETVDIDGSPALSAVITNITGTTVTITLTETDNDNDTESNTLTISGLRFIANDVETHFYYGSASTVSIAGMSPGITEVTGSVMAEQAPQASNGSPPALCSGEQGSLMVSLSDFVMNGVPSYFNWSADSNPDVTGETTSLEASSYITDDLVNISQEPQPVIYTVTPSSSGGCTGSPFTITVTVNPKPDIIITNSKPLISSGDSTLISYTSTMVGNSFSYMVIYPPAGITGFTSASTQSIKDTLLYSGGPDANVEYTIHAISVDGCMNDSTAIVTVRGFPTVLVSDSLALVALYDSTDGPNWLDQAEWLTGAVTSWQGITVVNSRVTEINMNNNNVTGVLPSEIGDLTELTKLVIAGLPAPENGGGKEGEGLEIPAGGGEGGIPIGPRVLHGPLPASIVNLTNLTVLNLSGNAFNSVFPAEILTLTSLEDLDLSYNQFSGTIPAGIQNLPSLTYLNLALNSFSGSIPMELTTLGGLIGLKLSDNQLTGTVPDLSLLTNLEEIKIQNNGLSDIPDLSSLSNLADLDISNNNFTFEDIEPYYGNSSVVYAPQKKVAVSPIVQNLSTGDTFTASVSVGGSANQYYWQKGTEDISGENSNILSIPDISTADAGDYRLRTISSLVPDLEIYSDYVTLNVSLTNIADSLALVALYTATSDATGWTNSTNWLSGNVDTWHGVTVTAGRVTEISLDNNNLVGTLPAEIGDLSALEKLNLSGNNISGLPANFFNMTALTDLNLGGCLFSGSIPAPFGNLTNLDTLYLSENSFSGAIPNELATIPGLVWLTLNDNQLTGTVPDFSSLSGLFLQNNDLTVLPDLSTGSLTELDISNNKFTFEDIEPNIGIATINYTPQKKFSTPAVQNVNSGLSFNASFTVGGAANIYQWLKNEVDIPGANLTSYTKAAVAPADAGTYQLRVTNSTAPALTLYSENITLNVLTSVSDSLAIVALYSATGGPSWSNKTNWLTGALNTWHGITVTNGRVTAIDLTDNNLTGTLPAALGNLSVLTVLDLGSDVNDTKSSNANRNSISGSIPTEIGNLTNLTLLNLSSNDLTGTLPVTLSNLVQLQELWLTGNNLTLGAFPSTILVMTNLRFLRLSGCGITGSVPPQIQNLASLKSLLLNNNQLTAIPSETSNLTQLQSLYLGNNLLTALPALSGMSSLTDLRVANNKLTFEDLEPNVGISSFAYSPQDSVGVKNDFFIQAGTSHTFTTSVAGSSNEYKWKKDGVIIPGATASTFVIASPDFVHEGTYTFEVTNTVATALTLFGRPVQIKVSSLKRDSLALVQLYNSTKGNSWTNKTGWLSGNLSAWNGVAIANSRVTGLSLGNNNLDGPLPAEVNEMFSLKTVDVSNNKITKLPSLLALTQLTAMNVSGNKLDFASLESNLSLLGVMTYSNQADIGTIMTDSVQIGSPYSLSVPTGGINNSYQWKRNTVTVTGAALNSYTITSLNRTNMGEYHCEITNSSVPGLTLKSAAVTILATTDLSGKLLDLASVPITKGKVTLFRITSNNGYDTIQVVSVDNSGVYMFKKIVLDNYQILGFADTLTYARALPTYYKSTPFWEEADTVFVEGSLNNLDIISQFKPSEILTGKFIIRGIVEQDDGVDGGRVKGKKPIGGAGVSVRRVENTGRGKAIVLTLVAYVFTEADGTFVIPHLPPANYKLNIQYPGYPMDEDSDIDFPITENSPTQYNVEATVKKDKITVKQSTVTGIRQVEEYSVNLYPNPAVEFITIQFAAPSLSRAIEMRDITGKKMAQADAPGTEASLDVRAVQRGLYLLQITDKSHVVKTLRVIIK